MSNSDKDRFLDRLFKLLGSDKFKIFSKIFSLISRFIDTEKSDVGQLNAIGGLLHFVLILYLLISDGVTKIVSWFNKSTQVMPEYFIPLCIFSVPVFWILCAVMVSKLNNQKESAANANGR